MGIPKQCRFTLEHAGKVYNASLSMFRSQGNRMVTKQGINIILLPYKGKYKIASIGSNTKLPRVFHVVVTYPEIERLILQNLNRQVRKKEAIDILHKQANHRIEIMCAHLKR